MAGIKIPTNKLRRMTLIGTIVTPDERTMGSITASITIYRTLRNMTKADNNLQPTRFACVQCCYANGGVPNCGI